MNRSKSPLLFLFVVLALAFSAPASAIPITSFTATISLSDPTQSGRLSRNNIPQDWSGGEAFPGVINTSTTYHYHAYDLPAALFSFGPAPAGYAGFVQVNIDSASGNSFGSAYDNSYDPTNKMANWLGDAGTSGNFFGTGPLAFQVYLPQGHDLVLVFNNTGAGNVGVGDNLNILVEGFTDTEYTDPVSAAAVPEPSSLVLLGSGLVGVVRTMKKKFLGQLGVI